ncbi:MAG: hypothetical protein J0I19_05980 [Alphaproteobacteria bacterium]|nr:hypothetical protein [Alphaproteobacteria bacterium]
MKNPKTKKFASTEEIRAHLDKRNQRREDYYIALGDFINTFSDVESQLVLALADFAKVDKKTAKALFSGVRVDQASDFIRRLGAVKKIKPKIFEELTKNLLPQIKVITDLRNDVIHYGARLQSIRLTINNQRGIGRTQVRRYIVSAKMLESARMDLGMINLRLFMACNNEGPEDLPPPIRAAIFGPWRYTPRVGQQKNSQSGRKRKDSAKPQARPRQP